MTTQPSNNEGPNVTDDDDHQHFANPQRHDGTRGTLLLEEHFAHLSCNDALLNKAAVESITHVAGT